MNYVRKQCHLWIQFVHIYTYLCYTNWTTPSHSLRNSLWWGYFFPHESNICGIHDKQFYNLSRLAPCQSNTLPSPRHLPTRVEGTRNFFPSNVSSRKQEQYNNNNILSISVTIKLERFGANHLNPHLSLGWLKSFSSRPHGRIMRMANGVCIMAGEITSEAELGLQSAALWSDLLNYLDRQRDHQNIPAGNFTTVLEKPFLESPEYLPLKFKLEGGARLWLVN